MKITLSADATQALDRVIERLRFKNELVGKNASATVNQIIIAFDAIADAETLSKITESLLSPRMRKNALLKKLAKLSDGVDIEMALKVIEKSVRKLDRSSAPISANPAQN